MRDLRNLAEAYDKYLENVRNKKHVETDIENLENYNAELKGMLDRHQEELGRKQAKKHNLTQEKKNKEEELSIYRRYSESGEQIEITDDHRKRRDKCMSRSIRLSQKKLIMIIKRLEHDYEKQVERLRNAENDYKKERKKLSKDSGRSFDDIDDRCEKMCI